MLLNSSPSHNSNWRKVTSTVEEANAYPCLDDEYTSPKLSDFYDPTGTILIQKHSMNNKHRLLFKQGDFQHQRRDNPKITMSSRMKLKNSWTAGLNLPQSSDSPMGQPDTLCAQKGRCVHGKEALDILEACHNGPTGGHHGANLTAKKIFDPLLWTTIYKCPTKLTKTVTRANDKEKLLNGMRCRQNTIQVCEIIDVMQKYGVTHRLSTAYHPQTSGQVEVSNRGLKRILERTIGENRASWHAIFRSEHEHNAYWALKQANFDLSTAGDHRKVQLNELNELRDHAYENSLIYKEKTKRIHDSKIKNRVFNVGDRVLLFNSRLKIFSRRQSKILFGVGPITISQSFITALLSLSQANGLNFKLKEMGQASGPKTSASWEATHAYPIARIVKALVFSVLSIRSLELKSSASFWKSRYPNLID
ncbi:reverse transcriptase domain-containing protein [Tanacetum coccineum]